MATLTREPTRSDGISMSAQAIPQPVYHVARDSIPPTQAPPAMMVVREGSQRQVFLARAER